MRSTPSRPARRLAVGTLLIAVLASRASGQLLRGAVRDSASTQPIPGAVLIFLDATGRTLGRNITNERGDYSVALTPQIARMQVLRIGFRPRTIAIPPGGTGTLRIDVTMASIPMLLNAVNVIDQPNCPRRPDRPQAFALWEQAKSALLAIVVARDANPANMLRLRFARRMDDDKILSQSVHIDSASTARPYVAVRSAAEFIAKGFLNDSGGGTWFEGPDADVMLDPDFPLGYCFEIAKAERARPDQVGLAFKPANRKNGRVDIDGAFWIDTIAKEPRDIEYRYLGLDRRLQAMNPGGRISFRTMRNGVVFIDRWVIRVVGARADTTEAGGRPSVRSIIYASETGGEVAHATWPESLEWQASLGTLRGRTVSSEGLPLAHRRISLAETDYRTVSDSGGYFEISNLLPGPYTITVGDSTLDTLGVALETAPTITAKRDTAVTAVVRVPSATEFVGGLCARGKGVGRGSVKLLGRVVTSAGDPLNNAHVRLSIQDPAAEGGWKDVALGGETGSDGLFSWCRELPRHSLLEIAVTRDGYESNVSRLRIDEVLALVKIEMRAVR